MPDCRERNTAQGVALRGLGGEGALTGFEPGKDCLQLAVAELEHKTLEGVTERNRVDLLLELRHPLATSGPLTCDEGGNCRVTTLGSEVELGQELQTEI